MTRTIHVIIFGLGNVGRTLIKQVINGKQHHAKFYNLQFNITAVVDSSAVIHNTPSLTDSTLNEIIDSKVKKQKLNTRNDVYKNDINELIRTQVNKHTIVVDCSASDSIHTHLINALKQGAGVTLANKKPLTLSQSIYNEMLSASNRSRLRYESTCGAGTPMITALQRLIAANDTPTKVQGTFSGTLGYLTSGIQDGHKYSDVVYKAAELGYTEPDARDDLGGVDVARKALIIARTSGMTAEMKDIEIEALYPDEYSKLSIDEFMKSLPKLDADYAERNKQAQTNNQVLRYVATMENNKLSVGLKALPNDSPIGLLNGTENMIEFHTPIYTPKPCVVRGFGAGGEVTAAGVLADMIELADVLVPQ